MSYTTNILALPLVLIVWAVDMYMFLLLVRIIAGRLDGEHAGRLCELLKPFTDTPPQTVGRWLTRRTANPLKPWVPWAIVALAGLILRHLTVAIIASM